MLKALGEFEELILFAALRLGDTAYGASIRREIEERTGRSVTAGSVYTVLDRLESRGLVASFTGEPTPERGGRRKKYYRIERTGAELLQDTYQAQQRMASGVAGRLEALLKDPAA
jgi:DNA-binding PadR family transcriptional regulator